MLRAGGTYIEDRPAFVPVKDAVIAALVAAYGQVTEHASGLEVPAEKVFFVQVPGEGFESGVAPPFGVVLRLSDGQDRQTTDFTTRGKRASATVRHVSECPHQVLEMASCMTRYITTNAVGVSGFHVLETEKMSDDIFRKDPEPGSNQYYAEQRWGFRLRPAAI